MKSKFGIVSSFDVLCGNATYSEAIAQGLDDQFEVDRIDIPEFLQKKYAPSLLNSVIERLQRCEYVNIQIELGLYGPTPSAAARTLRALIKNCEKFSVTMHRIDEPPRSLVRQIYNLFKSGNLRHLASVCTSWLKDWLIARVYFSIVNEVVSRGGKFIVHTNREKRRLTKINRNANVSVYPIVWPNRGVESLNLQSKFLANQPIVGLFGFVSPYKNYEVVAEGLAKQPFNILIAGGTHPQSPSYGQNSSDCSPSYIRKISNLFSTKRYSGRVFFVTSPPEAELIQLIQSVDIVCVPYLETGQSGSGICSLAIQYGRKVVFSDNACTRELVYFLNQVPRLFDVDSPLGLACAINDALSSDIELRFDGYEFSGLLGLYRSASGCRD